MCTHTNIFSEHCGHNAADEDKTWKQSLNGEVKERNGQHMEKFGKINKYQIMMKRRACLCWPGSFWKLIWEAYVILHLHLQCTFTHLHLTHYFCVCGCTRGQTFNVWEPDVFVAFYFKFIHLFFHLSASFSACNSVCHELGITSFLETLDAKHC